MSRSLLSQLEQLAGSETYDDLVSGLNTGVVAEPADSTISGSVEYDLNLLRSHLREIKDLTSDWYAGLPTYAAAVDGSTISGSLINIVTPTHGTGNVLDAKSVLLPVDADNSGAGFAIVATDTGFLYTTATQYADAADRRGLPIFASTGTYYDEGAGDATVRIDLLDLSTGNEFEGSNGAVVFGKFHDGADNGGTGDGVDAWVEFYTASGSYVWAGSDPSDITMVFPQRKIMSEMDEEDWFRTDFVSGFEGDVELIEDIENLWNFTGAGNGVTDPTWTNTTAYYLLDANPTDLEAAINDVNDGVGDRDYTVGNYYPLLSDGATVSTSLEELNLAIGDRDYTDGLYLTDGQTITASLEALNVQLATVSGAVTGPEKYLETLSLAHSKDTLHGLPYGITYTPNSSDTQPGKNMDVYVDGQLLAADYATLGNNDYAETSASGITPHFNIRNGANITYIIRS